MKTRMIDRRIFLVLALTGCGQASELPTVAPESNQTRIVATMNAPMQTSVTPARQSAFTALDMRKCRTIEESDEGPYWRGSCPGYAGWKIQWYESDLRQSLTLIDKAGHETDLNLSILVGKGAFNNLAGGSIEWRGPDATTPDSLIVRMEVDHPEDVGGPRRPISRLAVVRLAPTPCVVGVVEPTRDQNAKARAIADAPKRGCLTE